VISSNRKPAAARTPLLARFMEVYQALRHDNLDLLSEVYDAQVVFEDPLHKVEGLEALTAYFERMYSGVESIRFEFGDVVEGRDQAMLTWTMHMQHRRLRRGEQLDLPGATHIRFARKVEYHRDYFDAGALLYERLPLLGGVVRAIRRRV
jgi:hypothetical protein